MRQPYLVGAFAESAEAMMQVAACKKRLTCRPTGVSLGFVSCGIGCRYRVECATNAAGTNWTLITNIMLPTSPYLWFDLTSPTAPSRFYRAVLE